jgi:hypothetical protein
MKSYIVWYRAGKAVDVNLPHAIVSGRNATEAQSIWKRTYPERKIVRIKVWH